MSGPRKVPVLANLERSLAMFDSEVLKDRSTRLSLLLKLRSAFIFIRDYDTPDRDVMNRALDNHDPIPYGPSGPTVSPADMSMRFRNE